MIDLDMESPVVEIPGFDLGMTIELNNLAYCIQNKETPILNHVQHK